MAKMRFMDQSTIQNSLRLLNFWQNLIHSSQISCHVVEAFNPNVSIIRVGYQLTFPNCFVGLSDKYAARLLKSTSLAGHDSEIICQA